MADKTELSERMCICPECPSFVSCGEKHAFCIHASGRSKCIKNENGCICGGCPVTEKLNLQHGYYCTRGSEKEQSRK